MSRKIGEVQRRYSDNDKASALAALAGNGGNLKRTAGDLGIPLMTLSNWSKGVCGVTDDVTALSNAKKLSLAELWEKLAIACVGEAYQRLQDDPASVDFDSLGKVGGISTDKVQLLKGEPTNITRSFADLSPDERKSRLEQWRKSKNNAA